MASVTTAVYDCVVLGAGFAGLTAANFLAERGHSVCVIDAREECGGAHRSFDINGYSFDAGSFFFELNHPLFTIAPTLFDQFLQVRRRQQRVLDEGVIRSYPVDPREIMDWPIGDRIRAAASLVGRRLVPRRGADVETAAINRLGDVIYRRTGLANYIFRLHEESPDAIDRFFYDRRMDYVERSASLQSLLKALARALRQTPLKGEPQPALLAVRPRQGFAHVYGEVRRALQSRGVAFMLNAPVRSLRPGRPMRIGTLAGEVRAQRVIGAMPLQTLHELAFGAPADLSARDLVTLFLSAPACRFDGNVLYNFSASGAWKRLTKYSDFYGRVRDRAYFGVEFTVADLKIADPEALLAGFLDHAVGARLIEPGVELEGFTTTASAYPVYRAGTLALVRQVEAKLGEAGILTVGRQGRFDYLPTSILVSRATTERLKASP